MTELGEALSFSFGGGVDNSEGAAVFKVSLWSPACQEAMTPLVAGCRCFACTHHTRAYVHHLLQTHEMLGPVLLMQCVGVRHPPPVPLPHPHAFTHSLARRSHNVHHYAQFFAAIRASIRAGSFEADAAAFAARYALPNHVSEE